VRLPAKVVRKEHPIPVTAAQFLSHLSQDPALGQTFSQDPDAVKEETGLFAEGREALKCGNPERIREHFGSEGPPGCMIVLTVTAQTDNCTLLRSRVHHRTSTPH